MNISSPSLPPLALIAGATASGKSALALALAQAADGVVINADSAQVYRDLRVLSARPSEEEEARVPHRLYGYRDGAQPCSAAAWAADAREAVREAQAAGKLPILIGGTGLYLRTLLEGIAPVPEIEPEIRQEVRAMPVEKAFAALVREDIHSSHGLRPTDTSRVARALEVVRSTGRALAEWQRHKVGGIATEVALRPLILLPPRDWLTERCDRRFGEMMGPEGLAEAGRLLARKLDPALPVMRAIGLVQIAAFLRGEISREEALAAGRTATRQYAKRQYTWFSRQPPEDWPRFWKPVDEPEAQEEALALLLSRDREQG
ncbi:MAG TPA: tRNA (adenosine(37)-N6)-dimethylallyltransferase MiaA [Allosphingosinicella sp.]|nr:tRNA (adenosine(37)-N6)-dimethylallyltransferase MiaA [Allosphingosinicella sp.]